MHVALGRRLILGAWLLAPATRCCRPDAIAEYSSSIVAFLVMVSWWYLGGIFWKYLCCFTSPEDVSRCLWICISLTVSQHPRVALKPEPRRTVVSYCVCQLKVV